MNATRSGPPTPLFLGDLLLGAGMVRPNQLQTALALQRNSGEKLGDALVHLSALDAQDTAATLMVQHQLRLQLRQEAGQLRHAIPDCLRVGELLVARGDVSRAQLSAALHQQSKGTRLGDVLLRMGAIRSATLERVLALQLRLLSAVLCAGIGFAFAFSAPAAHAGGAGASLGIGVTISKRLQVQLQSQPGSFTLSAQDIARGYLDINQESVLEVETNSAQGVALEFHGADSGADIQSVLVSGGAPAFRMPASGGVMLLLDGWHPTVHRTLRLAYRLMLGPAAHAGTYAWPLSLRVSAL